jgi:hypothetical protein
MGRTNLHVLLLIHKNVAWRFNVPTAQALMNYQFMAKEDRLEDYVEKAEHFS